MPSVRVGQTEIAYELRRTATASERRITVTPGYVEVLALTTDDDAAIAGFLDRKRQWLFDTIRELDEKTATQHFVPRFMSGSKIPFRGRMASLTVRRRDGTDVKVTHRAGFLVDLPSWVEADASDAIVAMHLKLWLKRQVRQDVQAIAAAYRKRHGLQPRSIRVADMKSGWGSCGAEGGIQINWHLVFAPKRVLEYVVVHELAHLKHRSHGDAFWAFLASILPDYERAKAWLDRHQASLDSGFLNVGPLIRTSG